MRLLSVKLQNIRSYLNQTIEFPDGSLLVVGDIGTGKSTILLAIEFALFGIMHGTLSGNALLRSGKKEGSVELKFLLGNQEFIVKRALKRSKDKVMQQSGYIIRGGVKREATPIELKSEIIDLLGYPRELLTKSKNLIYRYTVYTPQEEMKQILQEEKEYRLDTLRRVFGIDKYKRIREAAAVYVRELKEKAKLYEGKIFDLAEKQSKKKELKESLKSAEQKIKELKPKVENARKEAKEHQKTMSELEKKMKKAQELQHSMELQNSLLKNKVEQRENLSKELNGVQQDIENLEKELKEKPKESAETLKKLKAQKEGEVKKKEELYRQRLAEINKLIRDLENSQNLQKKIGSMDNCPVCLQKVGDEHKKDIHEREAKKVAELKSKLQREQESELKDKEGLQELKESLEKTRSLLHEQDLWLLKQKNFDEKNTRVKELQDIQDKLKKEVGEINAQKLKLQEQLEEYKEIEAEYANAKNTLDTLSAKEKELAVEFAGLEKEKEGIQQQIDSVEKELQERLKAKETLENTKKLRHWLEDFFLNLMNVMERHVMARVYAEFNELFQQWFNMLIEDEVLSVRLDDELTPVIEQNGYEVELENLSGGEKTSCALAYRLALNKVINDVISTIKTRDIIILDEPTDGFSTEQLDKVRDVLDQLNMPQVIIVSHESKIESFVDNIMRVRKEEHVSSVA